MAGRPKGSLNKKTIKNNNRLNLKPLQGKEKITQPEQIVNISELGTNDLFIKLNEDLETEKNKNEDLNTLFNDLQQNFITSENEISLLKNEILTLKVNSPSFIFDPVKQNIFNDMNRVIAYNIKEGLLKRDDKEILQRFTATAIKYFIKNEFEHILK